jgi:hypothetical protein
MNLNARLRWLAAIWLAAMMVVGLAIVCSPSPGSAQAGPPYPAMMNRGPNFSAPPADAPVQMPIPHILESLSTSNNSIDLLSTSNNLIDHGGPVLPSANIYVVYWGNPSDFRSDLEDGLSKFFEGFGNSGYSNILTQYFRGALPPTAALAGTASDTSAPPPHAPKVKTIVTEACKFTGETVDPNGIYFVVTSNSPANANYCAWHDKGNCNGSQIPVVYLPNVDNVCDISSTNRNGYSRGTQSIVNYAAHELAETMTDPQINAWLDSRGQEVADKCDTSYGKPVTLSNGTIWRVQKLWSNATGKCEQSIPLP